MCGIVGYVGPEDSVPILMEGLKRLEYRGYDSAGLPAPRRILPGQAMYPEAFDPFA